MNRKRKNKTDVCQKFSLVNSTSQMIWKKKTKIFSAYEQSRLKTQVTSKA